MNIKRPLRISCLPIYNLENPYQELMMKGLNSNPRLDASYGIKGKFFGIIKTAVYRRPDYIHFDWIETYYLRRKYIWTLLTLPSFVLQIWFVRYILGIKMVWTLHNVLPHDIKNIKLAKWCERFFVMHLQWIRVFSESTIARADEKLTFSNIKYKVFPEGSYINYYPNSISKSKARAKLGIPVEQKVLLYLGKIRPYKGISELVSNFQKLSNSNFVLIIAGKVLDNAYYQTFKNTSHPNIKIYPSFIPDEELQIFYNASDAVVLPFKKIENSGSLINAMGFKKPIIAPKIGVIEERLIRQKELLYEESLLEGLINLTKLDSEQLKIFGLRNFDQLQQFNWSDFSEAFL